MAVESDKVLESFPVPCNGEYSDGPVQLWKSSVQDNEHLSDMLNDFESYWQDLNERLIISRVVSDSVIKGMVNAVSQEAAEIVSSKETEVTELKERLLEEKMARQLQTEVEVIVVQNAIQSVREKYQRGTMNCQSCFGKIMQDKLRVVSSICQDLDSAHKSLFNIEKLNSHGSLEIDHLHCRVLSKHGSPSSLREANSRHKDCNSVNLPENFELSRLKHLTVDELYSHFRDVITELKRDHEMTVQDIIEEYFSLKREFLKERELLKERGLFLPLKSKDFDTLRKTIPEVITKLNDILSEDEDFSKNCELRDTLDNLITENRNLSDLLNTKVMEIKSLSSQVSEVEEKLTKHILDEACWSKLIVDLKMSLKDVNIEASVSEEIYNCIIRELDSHIKLENEECGLRSSITQETLAIVLKEAIREAEAKVRLECRESSNMQAITLQDVFGIVFQEVLRDTEVQLKSLMKACLQKNEVIACLESEASDMKKTLALEAQEKQKLNQQILELEAVMEEKEKILMKEKEQFEKVLCKMNEQQEALISQRKTELESLSANLDGSLQRVDQYEYEVNKLTKALELVQLDSKKLLEERDTTYLLLDAKDSEYREQMESSVHAIREMTKAFVNFELRTMESMKWNNVRLENSAFQLGLLVKKVNVLRRTGLLYKQRLERRCSDLQKAEAEVDLLGDEVETLLGLLEKIYIALDHYAPILQHYPGIMDILKLVERKLSAEYAKSIRDTSY